MAEHSYNFPNTGYVRLPTVQAVVGIGKSTIWAWVKEKKFPQPIKLSPRCTAWRVEDLRAWLETQAMGGQNNV